MSNRTYQEFFINEKRVLELTITRRANGEPYAPSGAFVEVRGSENRNTVSPRVSASVVDNRVSTLITTSVTASAALYDVIWEIRRNDNINYHCTQLLVKEVC